MEHEATLGNSNICQQKEIQSADWLQGDGALGNQAVVFVMTVLRQTKGMIQTCGNLL